MLGVLAAIALLVMLVGEQAWRNHREDQRLNQLSIDQPKAIEEAKRVFGPSELSEAGLIPGGGRSSFCAAYTVAGGVQVTFTCGGQVLHGQRLVADTNASGKVYSAKFWCDIDYDENGITLPLSRPCASYFYAGDHTKSIEPAVAVYCNFDDCNDIEVVDVNGVSLYKERIRCPTETYIGKAYVQGNRVLDSGDYTTRAASDEMVFHCPQSEDPDPVFVNMSTGEVRK